MTKPRGPVRQPVTFETVRLMALAMSGVEEGTSYGTPAFKVQGTLFARLREEGDSLVVRVSADAREELIAAEPGTYYVTDHYRNYPWVLVRLPRVHPDALRDLLRTAWRLASSSTRRTRRRARRK